MRIIGCDFHPSWQQVAWLDAATGETGESQLVNGDGSQKKTAPSQGRRTIHGASNYCTKIELADAPFEPVPPGKSVSLVPVQ